MTPRSSSDSNSPGPMKRKTCARRCERACCSTVIYFPLAFVYGVTTWAAWVLANMALRSDTRSVSTTTLSALGIILYGMLNWSYTTAVFTPPGFPGSSPTGYSSLPTHDSASAFSATSFTVKSTGETRFCKKCQARKPDRAHHCSTCKQCVLKMDHHCPWLATCVGLRNYKAFLLFLVYTSVYCWICFGSTTKWLWKEVFSEAQYTESFMPVNYIMLSVVSAIIGLVLTGFTGWHISMAMRGMTTIECLEKTRYLSPLRKSMQKQQLQRDMNGHVEGDQGYGQQLAEIHANALPGVTRPEEGEAMLGYNDLELGTDRGRGGDFHRSYASLERARERQQYEDYLDEQDSQNLPNAFDLGWKRNLLHLFGERPLLWFSPIPTTQDDGWRWEPNPKWVEAREAMRQDREREREHERTREQNGRPAYADHLQNGFHPEERHYLSTSDGTLVPPGPEYFNQGTVNQRSGSQVSLKTLRKNVGFDGDEHFEVSSDESDDDDNAEFQDGQPSGGSKKWP